MVDFPDSTNRTQSLLQIADIKPLNCFPIDVKAHQKVFGVCIIMMDRRGLVSQCWSVSAWSLSCFVKLTGRGGSLGSEGRDLDVPETKTAAPQIPPPPPPPTPPPPPPHPTSSPHNPHTQQHNQHHRTPTTNPTPPTNTHHITTYTHSTTVSHTDTIKTYI